MEDEYKSNLKNWKQYFSQSKKRNYYFNSKTGESLWTYEEVEQKVKQLMKNNTSSSNIEDVVMSDLPDNDEQCDPMDVEIATDIHNLRNDFIINKNEFENLNQTINQNNFLDSEFELILILDTNIFISNLEQLKELSAKLSSKIIFFVPWVVVQELDNLKNKKYIEKYIFISQKAQEAIKFIHSLLNSKTKSFCFENFYKSNILIDGCIPKNNDDKILNSALQISKENPKKRCVMVTNDLNLINKSKICNFEALNFKIFKTSLNNENFDDKSFSLSQHSLYTQHKEPLYDQMLDQFNYCVAHIIEEKLINSCTTVLSLFFEFEMKRIYDDLWLDLLLHKPPWTLATLIVSLNKVFNAMFCFTESPKSYKYNQEFQKLKTSIEDYNKILFFNKNNYLREFQSMASSMEVTQYTLNLLQSIGSLNDDSSFIFQVKTLENYLIVAQKIFEILQSSKTKLAYFENERESVHISDSLHHIESIWEKLKNFSLLKIEFLQNIDSKIKNDVCFNIHYSISHESLSYLNQFFENCIKNYNNEYLRRFSIAIYILYKIFQINIESKIEIQGDDLNEYQIIYISLKNFFTNMDSREKMTNVFWQFKEFENRLNMIEYKDFIDILKFKK